MNNQNFQYNKSYYRANRQDEDRIALKFYYRIATSYVKSGKVLDFGCGTGHLIKRFNKGFEAWAYDISPEALSSVREVAPYVNICNSLESLRQNTFDLIIAIHVLEHLPKPEETLMLFSELLNDGGVLLYVVPDVSGLGHRIKKHAWFGYRDPSHISLYSAEQWLSWTQSAGFTVVKTGTDGLWDVPYVPSLPLWLQKLIFYPVPAFQVFTGRLLCPARLGESAIIVARKGSRTSA